MRQIAYYDVPQIPDFSGISVPINVEEATSGEKLLDDFTVSDIDNDTIASCSLTGHDGKFDLRQINAVVDNLQLYLLSSAALNFDNCSSYDLGVECIDSAGETSSITITVDVIPNQAPIMVSPSRPVNINENEIAQRRIYTLNVTDPEGDAISCIITDVSPPETIFGIWMGSTDYEVYVLNDPNLNHDVTSTYLIVIVCSDVYGTSSISLTVDVEANAPPWFTNLPIGSNPQLDASSTPPGTSVFTVQANDTDSAHVTFSLTSNPTTPDLFQINANTGDITTSKDLIYAIDSTYDLTVTVSDGAVSATEILRLELTNTNTPPVITNLPDIISVSEEIASGSKIAELTIYDPDVDETISVTWSVTPPVTTSKFSLENSSSSTYELRLDANETLDYEIWNGFVFQFFVSDQKAETGPYVLSLDLIDENEPCYFDKTIYYVTTYEAKKGGGREDPGFIVSDPDENDRYTLSLVTSEYSDLFKLDGATGQLSFDTDYEVDQGVHPSNVTLTVQCADEAGETGTATLSITVEDVNDNAPEFGDTGLVKFFDQWDRPGTTIDTLNANDIDSGNNADIEYSWEPQDSTGSKYFSLNSNGAIILKVDPTTSLTYGETHRFIVTAEDQGSPSKSSSTTVDIVYREVTTTSTTTTTSTEAPTVPTFFDSASNVSWLVCAGLLAVLFLALLLYTVLKYCAGTSCNFFNLKKLNCCEQKPTRHSRKIIRKPDPKPTPFDFWNDDDMIRKASSKQVSGKVAVGPLPQPAPVE